MKILVLLSWSSYARISLGGTEWNFWALWHYASLACLDKVSFLPKGLIYASTSTALLHIHVLSELLIFASLVE